MTPPLKCLNTLAETWLLPVVLPSGWLLCADGLDPASAYIADGVEEGYSRASATFAIFSGLLDCWCCRWLRSLQKLPRSPRRHRGTPRPALLPKRALAPPSNAWQSHKWGRRLRFLSRLTPDDMSWAFQILQ